MSNLSDDVKNLMKDARELLQQTRRLIKVNQYPLSLIEKLQLRDDCTALEKKMKAFEKGKWKESDIQMLESLVIRLKTSSEALLQKR